MSFRTSTAEFPQNALYGLTVDNTQIFTVKQLAAEWQFSADTIQRWFVDEPGVFVVQRDDDGERSKPLRQPKRTLRIPAHVKERVWRRNCNAPVPVN